MTTPDLFAPDPPYQHTSETSKAAAESVRVIAPSLRERVLSAVRAGGLYGLTYDEIHEVTGILHATICARLNELTKMALIQKSGQTRLTRSKRQAAVYVAVRR